MEPGTLYVVATPIGNLADMTLRSLDILRRVRLIAAEDTRHTQKLLSHYNIHTPLISYHSHNAKQRGPQLIKKLAAGESIALVSDAGTPGISDPGFLLIKEVIDEDLPLVVLPGPSAVIAALAASGLPTQPFAFLGFPPARGSGRRRFFETYRSLPLTIVIFESPQRLSRTLQDILRYWGDRNLAVAREMTKRFEEVFRAKVHDAIEHFSGKVKGEVTLVVEGRASGTTEEQSAEMGLRDELEELLVEKGLSVKDAVGCLVQRRSLPRSMVYREALAVKKGLENKSDE